MSWFLESPWPAIVGGGIAEAVLLVSFITSGRVRVLGWMALAAAIASALVLVELWVVTDREQIAADVHAAAAALEAGDLDRVLSFVAPSALALQVKARGVVALRPRPVRVTGGMTIDVMGDVDPPQARLRCVVMVSHALYKGEVPVRIEAFLRKHEGKWLVYDAKEQLGM